jgi:hypothetical protein
LKNHIWHFIFIQDIEHRLENTLLLSIIDKSNAHIVCVVTMHWFFFYMRRNRKIIVDRRHVVNDRITIIDHVDFCILVQQNFIKMFRIWHNDDFLNNHNRYAFYQFTCWLIVDELDNCFLSVVDEHFMRWTDFMIYWFFVFNDWSIVVEDFSFFEIFDLLNLLKIALILNFFFRLRQFVAMCSISLHLWQMRCE